MSARVPVSYTHLDVYKRQVQNITGGGACLKLANTFGVPETFDLTFEHGRTRRSCRVVWRTSDKLGVMFEPAASTEN